MILPKVMIKRWTKTSSWIHFENKFKLEKNIPKLNSHTILLDPPV